MSKTDNAVSTVTEKLGEKSLQYLNALEEITKQYAPDVVNAALAVIQVDALQSVLWGVAGGVVLWLGALSVRSGVKCWKDSSEAWEQDQYKRWNKLTDAAFQRIFLGAPLAVGGGLFFAINLLNVWTWTAIFNPKLYLAYKIFGKLL